MTEEQSPVQIIVVGNVKGGTGKSTTSMHLIAGLLHAGYLVGSIDLDAPQATLTHYINNRRDNMESQGIGLPLPEHRVLQSSTASTRELALQEDEAAVDECLRFLGEKNDFIVIDTPGGDNNLSRRAHSYADTLITPMNDSFIDLDVLAKVEPDTLRILRPSRYAEMVWENRKNRIQRDGGSIDWIVARNRLSTLDSRNRRAVDEALNALSKRIGFRIAPGFSERMIFRELFLKGLTLLDLRDPEAGVRLNMSHLVARQEVRMMLEAIGLPETVERNEDEGGRAA
ncbi:MAG TPA: ATPase [Rhodospirillaceae bacterium]|nr:ATPase [Rhodospirillaceae bacterium]